MLMLIVKFYQRLVQVSSKIPVVVIVKDDAVDAVEDAVFSFQRHDDARKSEAKQERLTLTI